MAESIRVHVFGIKVGTNDYDPDSHVGISNHASLFYTGVKYIPVLSNLGST